MPIFRKGPGPRRSPNKFPLARRAAYNAPASQAPASARAASTATAAYLYGGNRELYVDDTVDYYTRYRRLNTAADDIARPYSIHKLHELRDWCNCALAYHTATVHANDLPGDSSNYIATVSDATYWTLVWGPMWMPLYGWDRLLRWSVAGSNLSVSNVASTRLIASTGIVSGRDASFQDGASTPLVFPDGALHYADASFPVSSGLVAMTGTVIPPVVVDAAMPGCWVTVQAKGAAFSFYGMHVHEGEIT